MDIVYIDQFKQKANVREVDTTNSRGYGGYKGQVYTLGNLELFDTLSFFRSGTPQANTKYLYGTTRVTKAEFVKKVKEVL